MGAILLSSLLQAQLSHAGVYRVLPLCWLKDQGVRLSVMAARKFHAAAAHAVKQQIRSSLPNPGLPGHQIGLEANTGHMQTRPSQPDVPR